MTRTYTDFVAQLATDDSPPDDTTLEQVLRCLRHDLRREMQRRGLWLAPPAFLNAVGRSWDEPETFTDLVHDCYLFIFVRRLKGLRAMVSLGLDIKGMVLRNIRNFLTQRQRQADPIGYRVFSLLQSALLRMIAEGQLHVLAGAPEIRNDTILGFDPKTSPEQPTQGLDERVIAWADDLLPELILARGGAVPALEARLTELIVGLRAQGVAVFCFKDLVDPMKRDVRQRWHALWATSVAELSEAEPELDEPLGELHRCVSSSIDDRGEKPKTREYLWRLWLFLRSLALGDEASGARGRPSDVRISSHLQIPRGRLPGLFATLRELVAACRARFERSKDTGSTEIGEPGAGSGRDQGE